MMLYLVCYDITSDKLRTKLADKLFLVGLERIQYSIFLGMLTDAKRESLNEWATKLLKNQEDCKFMMLPLNEWTVAGVESAGTEPLDWAYLKGEKLVMFF